MLTIGGHNAQRNFSHTIPIAKVGWIAQSAAEVQEEDQDFPLLHFACAETVAVSAEMQVDPLLKK